MLPMIIDNVTAVIPAVCMIIVLWMWSSELYHTTRNTTGGVISEIHLDKHTNILVQGLVGLLLFVWGVHGIALTQIDYSVVDPKDAFYLASDGLWHIDHSKVLKDDMLTLLTAVSSKYAIGTSLGILTFFHSAIHHLKDEREDRFVDDVDFVDKKQYWNKEKQNAK